MAAIRQGDDFQLDREIITNPITDFTTATKLIAILFIGTKEQKKYSIDTPPAGFGQVEVDGTNKDLLKIFIERADSKLFDVGLIDLYVLATFPNTAFPDNEETKSFEQKGILTIQVGKGLEEVL